MAGLLTLPTEPAGLGLNGPLGAVTPPTGPIGQGPLPPPTGGLVAKNPIIVGKGPIGAPPRRFPVTVNLPARGPLPAPTGVPTVPHPLAIHPAVVALVHHLTRLYGR